MIRRLARKGELLLVDDLRIALRADVAAAGGLKAFAKRQRVAPETVGRILRGKSKAQPGDRLARLYGLRVQLVPVLVGVR